MVDFFLENLPAISAAFSFLVQCGLFKVVKNWIKENKEKERAEQERKRKEEAAILEAVKCLLRVDIIKTCCKAEEHKCLPVHEVENLTEMFAVYTALGGNGAVKELYAKAISMPHIRGDYND